MSESSGEPRSPKWLDALIVLACLALVLGFLFRGSLERGQVIFANDSPLAGIQSHAFDEKSGELEEAAWFKLLEIQKKEEQEEPQAAVPAAAPTKAAAPVSAGPPRRGPPKRGGAPARPPGGGPPPRPKT